MSQKTHIVESIGETALLVPGLLETALRANDRAKYYMTLLQGAQLHALTPSCEVVDLRAERDLVGETDSRFDQVVANSRQGASGDLIVPYAGEILDRLMSSVAGMLAPLAAESSDGGGAQQWQARFASVRADLPATSGDVVPCGYVEALTTADRSRGDSIHLLIMDLHRELNRLQAALAERVCDGAHVFGLDDADWPLVRAFMHGVHATAAAAIGHPGLDTTVVRSGRELFIQNDIGTTDAHVVVIRIQDLTVSIIYTDVHRARLGFFMKAIAASGITWSSSPDGAALEYYTCTGSLTGRDTGELMTALGLIGSQLVFLIDWNKARKCLARFVKKSDAVAALMWAAERRSGHRAFLEAGGERLINEALERAAPQLRRGARLDEMLGRDGALSFVKEALRIAADAMTQQRSLRLIRDEVQAALLQHLHQSETGLLAIAADHAAITMALASTVHEALLRGCRAPGGQALTPLAARAKRWETSADELVIVARDEPRAHAFEVAAGLLFEADDAADGFEEAMFSIALLRDDAARAVAAATLEPLARVALDSAEEYVKCVEFARDVRRDGTREDVQQFLVAVDRVSTLEHESDEAERQAAAAILDRAADFRALHLLAVIAHGLEESVDALARSALTLRDAVMHEMLVA